MKTASETWMYVEFNEILRFCRGWLVMPHMDGRMDDHTDGEWTIELDYSIAPVNLKGAIKYAPLYITDPTTWRPCDILKFL